MWYNTDQLFVLTLYGVFTMANADNATLREILSVLPLTRVSNVTGYNGALLPQGCSISASATVTLTQNQWNFMSIVRVLACMNQRLKIF